MESYQSERISGSDTLLSGKVRVNHLIKDIASV
jgi:hypothetical protein